VISQYFENGSRNVLGFDEIVFGETAVHLVDEAVVCLVANWFSGGVPSFEIETPDQHRQLGGQVGGFFDG
jgi:hypothetical protein